MISTSLPKNEYRRVYFKNLVQEFMQLFNIDEREAKVMAERHVVYLKAKFDLKDEIHFGSGKITFKEYKPRVFSLICGEGVKKRQLTHVGKRTKWFVKFYKSRMR